MDGAKLALGPKNQVHMIYRAFVGGNRYADSGHAELGDGGWTVEAIEEAAGGGFPCFDADGRLNVAFIRSSGEEHEVVLSTRTSEIWESRVLDRSSTEEVVRRVSAASDGSGRVHVSWVRDSPEGGAARLWVASSPTWTPEDVPNHSVGSVHSFAVSASGDRHVVYVERREETDYFAYGREESSDWTFEDLGSDRYVGSLSIALEPATGRPHVSFIATAGLHHAVRLEADDGVDRNCDGLDG